MLEQGNFGRPQDVRFVLHISHGYILYFKCADHTYQFVFRVVLTAHLHTKNIVCLCVCVVGGGRGRWDFPPEHCRLLHGQLYLQFTHLCNLLSTFLTYLEFSISSVKSCAKILWRVSSGNRECVVAIVITLLFKHS